MKNLNRILFFWGIILIGNTCLAQDNVKNYEKFARSFSSIIDYPVELMRSCTPVYCLIKVQVDSVKNVTDMRLSDSADSLLNVEFNNHKHSLNTKLLEDYLKIEYAGSDCRTYLIPLSYSLHQMPCAPKNVKITLLNSYFKFNGNYVNGNIILLKPIGSLVHIQR